MYVCMHALVRAYACMYMYMCVHACVRTCVCIIYAWMYVDAPCMHVCICTHVSFCLCVCADACMRLFVCINIYMCVYLYTQSNACTHAYTYMCVCMHVLCIGTCVCMHVCLWVCMHACKHACILYYIHVYTCMQAWIHMHACICVCVRICVLCMCMYILVHMSVCLSAFMCVGVYLIVYFGLTASSVYLCVRMTGSSSSGDSSLSSDPSGSGCAAVLPWYRVAPYSIHSKTMIALKTHYIIIMFDVVHNIIITSIIITLNSHLLDHLRCM